MNFIKSIFLIFFCFSLTNLKLIAMDMDNNLEVIKKGKYLIRSGYTQTLLEANPITDGNVGIRWVDEATINQDQVWELTSISGGYYTISCNTKYCGLQYWEVYPATGVVKLEKQRPSSDTNYNNQKWLLKKITINDQYLFVMNKIIDFLNSTEMKQNNNFSGFVTEDITGSLLVNWQKKGFAVGGYEITCYSDESKCLTFAPEGIRVKPRCQSCLHQKWILTPFGGI